MKVLLKNILFPVLLGLLSGCGTLPNGQGWGEGATLLPGWARVQKAAWNAASSPHVWAPVGSALLLQVDHADERLSDWAIDHTPIYGSNVDAADASDSVRKLSIIAFRASVLATPSGNEPVDWTLSKAKGYGVQYSAILLTEGTTKLLKADVERERPDSSNDRSFPSGHTSTMAVHSMLACQNIELLEIPSWSRTTLKTGVALLPYAGGWARVEAGKHYTSDILSSVAIGNFLAMFINDAFLGVDSDDELQVTLDYLPGETLALGFRWQF